MDLFYFFCLDAKGRGSSGVGRGGGRPGCHHFWEKSCYDAIRPRKKTVCLMLLEMFSTVNMGVGKGGGGGEGGPCPHGFSHTLP